MRNILLPVLALMVPLLAFSQEASLEETFIRGNIAYGNGQFEEAEAAYRTILKKAVSAEVHYNLGNALARQDKWSEAAYHYLKASSLNPGFDAARANLLLAADRLELDNAYPLITSPARLMPENYWAILAAIAFWAAIVWFFHVDFVRFQLPLRKSLSGTFLIVFLLSLVALVQHSLFREWTVVAVPEASLRVAPTGQSPGEPILAEGEPVRIIASRNGFLHVMTRSGDEGFVQLGEVYPAGND